MEAYNYYKGHGRSWDQHTCQGQKGAALARTLFADVSTKVGSTITIITTMPGTESINCAQEKTTMKTAYSNNDKVASATINTTVSW